jgi:hypothetical protein
MDLVNYKKLSDFMKEEKIIRLKKTKTTLEIELHPLALVEYDKEKYLRENPDSQKETKKSNKKQKDELADFIYGSDEVGKEDIRGLYGI